tara:strand:- start:13805 stop:14104 length:300 start_codon:yes stop_codon:yes gene_type:complete
MNLGWNILGQDVDMDSPYLAGGYYLYAENPDNSSCPDEFRAGQMVIPGAGRVPTCGGNIFQENLPDIYLVDYRFKTIIRLIMIATIIMLIVAIAYKLNG